MKKLRLSLAFVLMQLALLAQNTNYGTSSGTFGTDNSFFGYFSGNAATAFSSENSFLGQIAEGSQPAELEMLLLE